MAALLVDAGVTEPTILAAALLHDTIEDTDTSRAELAQRFGEVVAALIEELTDDKSLPKLRRKQLQIEHAPHCSEQARLIKIADKIANLHDLAASPPKDWPRERRTGYVRWAQAVVERLDVPNPALLAKLDEAAQNALG